VEARPDDGDRGQGTFGTLVKEFSMTGSFNSDDDFHPIPEEEEPERLRKKWESEELEEQLSGKRMKTCPHCGESVERKSFFCLYCGERVFEESGLLGRLGKWIRDGRFLLVIALILISFFLLTVMF